VLFFWWVLVYLLLFVVDFWCVCVVVDGFVDFGYD